MSNRINLPYSKHDFYHFTDQIDIPLSLISNSAGDLVPGFDLTTELQASKLQQNNGYIVDSLSFSMSTSEDNFQDAIREPIKFQFKDSVNNSKILPDELQANIYLRQFIIDHGFMVSSPGKLIFVIDGKLFQHSGIASLTKITLFVSFILYRITDRSWVSANLKN